MTITAPRAYLACAGCHEMEHPDAMAGWQKSVHAKWLREDTKVAGPDLRLVPRRRSTP